MRSAPPAVRLCLGALCLLPLAAIAAQNDNAPALLRMKFRQGEASKYQVNIQATLNLAQTLPTNQPHQPPPQPMVVPINTSLLMQQQVTRVLSNGNGVLTIAFLSQQTTVNGSTAGTGANLPPITMTLSPLGKIASITGIPHGDMNSMLSPTSMLGLEMFLLELFLPSKPVRPGEAWTDSVHLSTLSGTGTAKSKFLRYETVGHYRTARIRTELTLPINTTANMAGEPVGRGSGAVSGVSGAVHMITERDFAVAEGKVIRSTGNGSITAVIKPLRASGPARPGMGIMPRSTRVSLKMTISTDLVP